MFSCLKRPVALFVATTLLADPVSGFGQLTLSLPAPFAGTNARIDGEAIVPPALSNHRLDRYPDGAKTTFAQLVRVTSGESQAPFFKTAKELFGFTALEKYPEAPLGTIADKNEPRSGHRRLLSDASLQEIAELMSQKGLGFLLKSSVAITRTQLGGEDAGFYPLMACLHPTESNSNSLQIEIFIPDFEIHKGVPRAQRIMHGSIFPEGLLAHFPKPKGNLANRLRSNWSVYRERRDLSRIGALPSVNEETLAKFMHAGVLHETGEGIWYLIEDVAQNGRNPAAKALRDRWVKLSKKHPAGVLTLRNLIKHYGNHHSTMESDPFDGNLFGDLFAMWVDKESLYYRFGEGLSDEMRVYFEDVARFLQSEVMSIAPSSPATGPSKANQKSGITLGSGFGGLHHFWRRKVEASKPKSALSDSDADPARISRRRLFTRKIQSAEPPVIDAPTQTSVQAPGWIRQLEAKAKSKEELVDRIQRELTTRPWLAVEAWDYVDARIPAANNGSPVSIGAEASESQENRLAHLTLQALSRPQTVKAQLDILTNVNRRTILRMPLASRLMPSPLETLHAASRLFRGFSELLQIQTAEGQIARDHSFMANHYLRGLKQPSIPPWQEWYGPFRDEVIARELAGRMGGSGTLEGNVLGVLSRSFHAAYHQYPYAAGVELGESRDAILPRTPLLAAFFDRHISEVTRNGLRPFTEYHARTMLAPFLRGDFTGVISYIEDVVGSAELAPQRLIDQSEPAPQITEKPEVGTPRSLTAPGERHNASPTPFTKLTSDDAAESLPGHYLSRIYALDVDGSTQMRGYDFVQIGSLSLTQRIRVLNSLRLWDDPSLVGNIALALRRNVEDSPANWNALEYELLNSIYFAVDESHRALGFIMVAPESNSLIDMEVGKPYQGKGIGTELLVAGIHHLSQAHPNQPIHLHNIDWNFKPQPQGSAVGPVAQLLIDLGFPYPQQGSLRQLLPEWHQNLLWTQRRRVRQRIQERGILSTRAPETAPESASRKFFIDPNTLSMSIFGMPGVMQGLRWLSSFATKGIRTVIYRGLRAVLKSRIYRWIPSPLKFILVDLDRNLRERFLKEKLEHSVGNREFEGTISEQANAWVRTMHAIIERSHKAGATEQKDWDEILQAGMSRSPHAKKAALEAMAALVPLATAGQRKEFLFAAINLIGVILPPDEFTIEAYQGLAEKLMGARHLLPEPEGETQNLKEKPFIDPSTLSASFFGLPGLVQAVRRLFRSLSRRQKSVEIQVPVRPLVGRLGKSVWWDGQEDGVAVWQDPVSRSVTIRNDILGRDFFIRFSPGVNGLKMTVQLWDYRANANVFYTIEGVVLVDLAYDPSQSTFYVVLDDKTTANHIPQSMWSASRVGALYVVSAAKFRSRPSWVRIAIPEWLTSAPVRSLRLVQPSRHTTDSASETILDDDIDSSPLAVIRGLTSAAVEFEQLRGELADLKGQADKVVEVARLAVKIEMLLVRRIPVEEDAALGYTDAIFTAIWYFMNRSMIRPTFENEDTFTQAIKRAVEPVVIELAKEFAQAHPFVFANGWVRRTEHHHKRLISLFFDFTTTAIETFHGYYLLTLQSNSDYKEMDERKAFLRERFKSIFHMAHGHHDAAAFQKSQLLAMAGQFIRTPTEPVRASTKFWFRLERAA